MRLFVAVRPPDAAVTHLAAAVDAVRPSAPALRWQAPDRWHVTLAFLGDVGEERVGTLSTRLADAVAAAPATPPVHLAGAGSFGGRVLWVGLVAAEGDGDPPLRDLAAAVARAARGAGVPVERRRWRPHLTLARERGGAGSVATASAALVDYCGPSWPVGPVGLIRSYTGPSPRYATLADLGVPGAGRIAGPGAGSWPAHLG